MATGGGARTKAGLAGADGCEQPVKEDVGMANTTVEVTKVGVTFGSALAMAISFNVNQSVFWALIHGVFSWFYVVYYVVVK